MGHFALPTTDRSRSPTQDGIGLVHGLPPSRSSGSFHSVLSAPQDVHGSFRATASPRAHLWLWLFATADDCGSSTPPFHSSRPGPQWAPIPRWTPSVLRIPAQGPTPAARPDPRANPYSTPPPGPQIIQYRACCSLGPAPERSWPSSSAAPRPRPLVPKAWPRPLAPLKSPRLAKCSPVGDGKRGSDATRGRARWKSCQPEASFFSVPVFGLAIP